MIDILLRGRDHHRACPEARRHDTALRPAISAVCNGSLKRRIFRHALDMLWPSCATTTNSWSRPARDAWPSRRAWRRCQRKLVGNWIDETEQRAWFLVRGHPGGLSKRHAYAQEWSASFVSPFLAHPRPRRPRATRRLRSNSRRPMQRAFGPSSVFGHMGTAMAANLAAAGRRVMPMSVARTRWASSLRSVSSPQRISPACSTARSSSACCRTTTPFATSCSGAQTPASTVSPRD